MMHSTDALCNKVVAPPTIHGLAMRVLSDAYLAKGEKKAGLRSASHSCVSHLAHSCVSHLAQLCFAPRTAVFRPPTPQRSNSDVCFNQHPSRES